MNGSVKRVILGEAIVLVAWLVIMFVCKNALMNPIVFAMSLGFGVLAFAVASISATMSDKQSTVKSTTEIHYLPIASSCAYFNMRKPLSIGMFVRARFETGLFRFPSGEPAHAAWLSRRLPGKLISAGSCGCASGGQPGMSAHPTAFRFSVRRYRTNPVFCRARPGGCPSKRS